MIELFSTVWPSMPKYVVNTHEDSDHVWGNQLFRSAEIIAHSSVPERMKMVANPEPKNMPTDSDEFKKQHPGIVAGRKTNVSGL